MAISFKGDAALSVGQSATFSPAMPAHAAGDMLIAVFTSKGFGTDATVAGWTDLGSGTSGTTVPGIDVGSMRVHVWYKEAASSAETAPSFVESGSWGWAGGGVACWQKGAGEVWDTPVVVFGGDENLDKDLSATMASDPGFVSGDGVQIVIGVCSDLSTPLTAGPGITATGATFGTVTKDRDQESAAGQDGGMVTAHCLVTAGTSSAAAVVTGTGTGDPGDPRWEVATVRLRLAAVPDNRVEIAWAEFEIPTPDNRVEVAWAELEIPTPDNRVEVAWAELEIPTPDNRVEVSWAEFEVPDVAPDNRVEVSWAELELPDVSNRVEIAWAELELPTPDNRVEVSWAELELPTPDNRVDVSWAELEIPNADNRVEIAWVELEIPDVGGPGVLESIVTWLRRRGRHVL